MGNKSVEERGTGVKEEGDEIQAEEEGGRREKREERGKKEKKEGGRVEKGRWGM